MAGDDEGGGRSLHRGRLVVAGALIAVILWFALANSGRVEVDYLAFQTNSRLIYVILASALLGAVAASLIRRRRQRD
jgi:uncharacterized integral membrane protein